MSATSSGGSPNRQRLSVIIRKVFVTIVVGAFAYFLTERFLDDDGPWSIMASVFLGGVAFVTQFLVEVEHRLDKLEAGHLKHRDALDRRIEVAFRQISEATLLHNMITEAKVPASDVSAIIRGAAAVAKQKPPLVSGLAMAELHRFAQLMRDLRNGEAVYEGEDRDWLLKLTQKSALSIKATSLTTVDAGGKGFTDGGLWHSDLGMRYLDIQAEAMKRGVEIKRIFITDIPQIAPTGPFLEICRQQAEIGVDVRIINPRNIGGKGINPNALFDFILFDDLLTYETTPASRPDVNTPPLILHTRLATESEHVNDRIKKFDVLWAAAERLADVEAGATKPSGT